MSAGSPARIGLHETENAPHVNRAAAKASSGIQGILLLHLCSQHPSARAQQWTVEQFVLARESNDVTLLPTSDRDDDRVSGRSCSDSGLQAASNGRGLPSSCA